MSKEKEIGGFRQVCIVTRYELLKHLRRRRLVAVLVITLAVAALQLVVPPAFNIPYAKEPKGFAQSFLGFVDMLIIICGAFFAGDAIASEFEHKTGYVIFPNPVKRVVLFAGKFLAALFSVLLMVGLYYAICAFSMLAIYGTPIVEVSYSFVYAFLYLLGVLGLTFLFSTILRGSMGATLLSFFTLFMILPITQSMLTLTGNEPWYIITYAAGIITQVINPPKVRVEKMTVGNMTVWIFHPDITTSVLVLLAYFLVTVALSILIFRQKQMT